MAAVRGLHRFDRQAAFSTWLYRITVNTCLDQLRRQRRRPTVAFDPTREQGEPTSGAPAIDAALADRLELQAALAELPEDFRIAVVLRDVADLEYLDIAEILGVPVGTVRSRIARGRAALAARLGNQPGSWRHPTERP